ncbi:MAG: hypothetical protein JWO56_2090, partial [Acidobacteria bacterium]|nr:hypothetical protein [Acidobacteriota bacterium]
MPLRPRLFLAMLSLLVVLTGCRHDVQHL